MNEYNGWYTTDTNKPESATNVDIIIEDMRAQEYITK